MAYSTIIILNNKYLSIFVNIWSILVTPTHVCYADQSRRRFFLHALLKKDMCSYVFFFNKACQQTKETPAALVSVANMGWGYQY